MSSNIVGNLMGAFVISKVNQSVFYMVLACLCVSSFLFFAFLRKPVQPQQSELDTAIGASVLNTIDNNDPDSK